MIPVSFELSSRSDIAPLAWSMMGGRTGPPGMHVSTTYDDGLEASHPVLPVMTGTQDDFLRSASTEL